MGNYNAIIADVQDYSDNNCGSNLIQRLNGNPKIKVPEERVVSGFYIPDNCILDDDEKRQVSVNKNDKSLNDMFYEKYNVDNDYTFLDEIKTVFPIPDYDIICYKCIATNTYEMEELYLLALKFRYTGNNIANVVRNDLTKYKELRYDEIEFKYGYELADLVIDIMLANELISKEDIKIKNKTKFDFNTQFYKTYLFTILTTFVSTLYDFMFKNKFAIIFRNTVYTTETDITKNRKLYGIIDHTRIEIKNEIISTDNYSVCVLDLITPQQHQHLLGLISNAECNMRKDSNTGKIYITDNAIQRHLYYKDEQYPLVHNKNLVPNPKINDNNENSKNFHSKLIQLTPTLLNNLGINKNSDDDTDNNHSNNRNVNANIESEGTSDVDNQDMDDVNEIINS
jgi:hypothetical protein